jgi:hypothetical protein
VIHSHFFKTSFGGSFFIPKYINRFGRMLKTPRDIVNDRLSWSSDDAIKNHCVYVLEQYLKEEPELTEQDLREALGNYLMGLE